MQDVSELLKYALDFETLGYEFYQNAAAQATDPVAASVLKALAVDEADHKWVISRYYEALTRNQGWPSVDLGETPSVEAAIKMLEETAGRVEPDSDCSEIYQQAHELELRSCDFYTTGAESAEDERLKHFFQFLARVERAHVKALDLLVGSSCRA